MKDKESPRQEMKQYDHLIADPKVIEIIKNLLKNINFKILGAYIAIKGEINISEIFNIFQERSFALPKQVNIKTMEFAKYNLFDNLEVANSGFLQPINNDFIVPDVLLIPGIAFDKKKNRLGRGLGFYDRYLKAHPDISKLAFVKMNACLT